MKLKYILFNSYFVYSYHQTDGYCKDKCDNFHLLEFRLSRLTKCLQWTNVKKATSWHVQPESRWNMNISLFWHILIIYQSHVGQIYHSLQRRDNVQRIFDKTIYIRACYDWPLNDQNINTKAIYIHTVNRVTQYDRESGSKSILTILNDVFKISKFIGTSSHLESLESPKEIIESTVLEYTHP